MNGNGNRAGWYVYGVTDADADVGSALSAARAIDPLAKPFVLAVGTVAAIVSNVSLAEFDEVDLPERLNDANWLIERAAAHEDVLERALAAATVIPFRFGTVYRDEAAVRAFLAERESELAATLRRLRGRFELGVKAFVDPDRLEEVVRADDEALAGLDAEIAAAPAGRAYMLRRRAERLLDDAVRRFEDECANAAHAALASVAEDARRNPPQRRELSGHSGDMILNGVYLVAASDDLRRVVGELGHRYERFGVEFDVTGPWPPYNFVAGPDA